ncbi:FAD-binding and (Fe-S)-binding domain-containing protein [Mucilaginibacter panaciglaebae]|uniref:D-lactate dehydrogenase (cytochrome) n=1 Tax=Mucilaginibacter panaciglaebae TaxID=502331 RepID=A0ABP7WZP0_9SPHI
MDQKIGDLLGAILPAERIKTDLIDLVSSAPDAGFYYLRPKAVVLPASEKEVIDLLAFSRRHSIPVTFRTAGTSLSGQSITDGILVDLSQHWNKVTIENNGELVRVKPGAIGAHVNTFLKKYQRKIGPDPASINAAMMGGIISNNASGMCCGVSKNSYHTVKYITFILPDGKRYNTELPADYERFKTESAPIYNKLKELRELILNDQDIYNKIRRKYQTKNTVGYSVNAFIDFEEPMDILAHLLIGAEGTLGFIAEAVLQTTPDYPEKLTGILYFTDIYSACQAIRPLTNAGAVAVELMDRASLQSIENIAGMPAIIKTLPDNAAALLVEFQGNTQDELKVQMDGFLAITNELSLLVEAEFTAIAAEQALFWKVRKGMFPAVGAVRVSGTSVILEDIAFPVDSLGDAIIDLQQLFKQHGYERAIIFGHAKDGNIHFVVTQAFDTAAEVTRYQAFLQDVVDLVVKKYNGALKAEHGTGRNMAPFVETEWGGDIYRIMKSVKETVDPYNLINPGVIINADKQAHIKNLKELAQVEEEVDRCIECGFCEHKCPSRDITLTPRKRIVVRRELLRLKNQGYNPQYKELLHQYQYEGLETCAVDGLCATACPVDINTGDLIKRLRREKHSDVANNLALFTARRFRVIYKLVRLGLKTGILINRLFGQQATYRLTKGLRKIIPAFPLWSNQLAAARPIPGNLYNSTYNRSVVYFPACISRAMGEPDGQKGVMQTFMDVSAKARINVIIPQDIQKSCCGQIYSSKGFKDAYHYMTNLTVSQLWEVSAAGKLPVVLDISSCTQTLTHCRGVLTEENKARFDQLTIIDSVTYIHDFVLPQIRILHKKENVVLHPVCSLQKMPGLETQFIHIARRFAKNVDVPVFAGCCGMAGDRGFLHPELTYSATRPEAKEIGGCDFDGYYSSSKTCEIALSDAVGRNYHSILMLVDECS